MACNKSKYPMIFAKQLFKNDETIVNHFTLINVKEKTRNYSLAVTLKIIEKQSACSINNRKCQWKTVNEKLKIALHRRINMLHK